MTLQELRTRHRVLLMLFHPHRECLRTSVRKEAVEGACNNTHSILEVLDTVVQCGVVGRYTSHYGVRVSVDVLRHRVERNVWKRMMDISLLIASFYTRYWNRTVPVYGLG